MYESKFISEKVFFMSFLANVNPKGLVGFGEITETILDFDNSIAKSSESFADTIGSGEKTAETINMFNVVII